MRHDFMLGFSLIELMVTLVVLAILASIAFPSYNEYVLRSRRTEGKAMLLSVQQQIERGYSDVNTYVTAVASAVGAGRMSEHNYYQVTSASATASTYTLHSTPQGGQAKDKCKTFTISEAGLKDVIATSSVLPTLTSAECW